MVKILWRGVHLLLEIVGVVSLVWGASVLYLRYMFKDFSGGHCVDTEQRILVSPDGKHRIKSFHRVCGDKKHAWELIYLSTGSSNPDFEYTPIVTVKNVDPGQTSVEWKGSSQVNVNYPNSAEIGDAYAKVLDVRVILTPSLPQEESIR